MYLTRHQTPRGPRWAVNGRNLPYHFSLGMLLELPRSNMAHLLLSLALDEAPTGALLPPLDAMHEVWAAGVTYLRSREAREAESETRDVYSRVYAAARPELFFKAIGWRVRGDGMTVRVRRDSRWNVPEPELTLVINSRAEIVGYCCGNDLSSRDIEGENPLYLPQAKVYEGACALGPGIWLGRLDNVNVPVRLDIKRAGASVFSADAHTGQMKRSFSELVAYLVKELSFPQGAFLMTGTCIVPPETFSLRAGDVVRVGVGELALENVVEEV